MYNDEIEKITTSIDTLFDNVSSKNELDKIKSEYIGKEGVFLLPVGLLDESFGSNSCG